MQIRRKAVNVTLRRGGPEELKQNVTIQQQADKTNPSHSNRQSFVTTKKL
jgi:hypothetical protein